MARSLHELALLRSKTGDAVAAERAFERAIAVGAASRDDLTVARSGAELVSVVGYWQAKYEVALGMRAMAEAAIVRAGNPIAPA